MLACAFCLPNPHSNHLAVARPSLRISPYLATSCTLALLGVVRNEFWNHSSLWSLGGGVYSRSALYILIAQRSPQLPFLPDLQLASSSLPSFPCISSVADSLQPPKWVS